jgi:hypothetical protein
MKAYNKNMESGYNKFRQKINNGHVFRKAYNTLSEVNTYALPIATAGSLAIPSIAPALGAFATALKGSQNIAGALKNTKI